MYNITQKIQNMKFDLISRSWPDPNRSCCISFDPYWRVKRNGAVFKPVSCFYQKLLTKNEWWTLVTAYGHNWPFEGSPRVFFYSSRSEHSLFAGYGDGPRSVVVVGLRAKWSQRGGPSIFPIDVEKWRCAERSMTRLECKFLRSRSKGQYTRSGQSRNIISAPPSKFKIALWAQF